MQHRLLGIGRRWGDDFSPRLVGHFTDEVDPFAGCRMHKARDAGPIQLAHLPAFEFGAR